MDIKKFIIDEFGLPEDVNLQKCPRVTYYEIAELLTKFQDACRQEFTIVITEGIG